MQHDYQGAPTAVYCRHWHGQQFKQFCLGRLVEVCLARGNQLSNALVDQGPKGFHQIIG